MKGPQFLHRQLLEPATRIPATVTGAHRKVVIEMIPVPRDAVLPSNARRPSFHSSKVVAAFRSFGHDYFPLGSGSHRLLHQDRASFYTAGWRFQLAAALIFLVGALLIFTPLAGAETGLASFYADRFEGRRMASGPRFHHSGTDCAHRTLRFGTVVRVTRASNGKSAICTVRDRGPFRSGRIIDLPKSIARKLGMIGAGVARVNLKIMR